MELEKKKLYVGNLVYSTGFREVKDLFKQYGEVGYVKIIEGKGFGFVEMATEEDAAKAKEALNGKDFGGRVLKGSKSGKVIGGAMDDKGAGYYFDMPAAYSGYMHRAVLSQGVEALDMRCLRLRKELWPLFEEVTGMKYIDTPATIRSDSSAPLNQWDRIFDYRTIPKDCDIPCLSYDLSEAIIKAGYTLLYQPEWETVWKK